MKKHTEMEIQILAVLSHIWAAVVGLLSTVWGKMIALALLVGATFAPISGLIHLTVAVVIIDALFGLAVTIKNKGWNKIMSSRLRDSIIKLFFYLLFIMLFFLIEQQLFEEWYIGCKVVFAITSGVEIWSILANMLILTPNLPFLRLFKKVFTSEMARKLGMTEDELKETINEPISKDNSGVSINS